MNDPISVASSSRKRYGVLLPHFGPHAQRTRLLSSARRIEQLGFDAIFVRDHVAFRPRGLESQSRDYLDAFVVLSAVAAVTERITLATAVLIPHRHPIYAAQLIGSLDRVAGPGRLLPVWGLGGIDREFDAIGMHGWDRQALLKENIGIIRSVWSGKQVDHEGPFYRFQDVDIHPAPAGGWIPMWYGGTSAAAVRRAVEYFDGWSAGHMPGRDYVRLRGRMLSLCAAAGRPRLETSITPLISPGRTLEDGARHVPIRAMSEEFLEHKYHPPASGRYETIADFDGAVLAGPADAIVEGVIAHQTRGVDLVIFDLRLRFDNWEECLGMIGEEVLPRLRRGAALSTWAADGGS